MKKLFVVLMCLCVILSGCTIDFSPYKTPFEQDETKWVAKELEMYFTVSEDNYDKGASNAYGSLIINGEKQAFFISDGRTAMKVYPPEAVSRNGIDSTSYLLKGLGQRISDIEYKFTIKDTKIELGGIKTVTFIREDTEAETTD